MSTHKYQIESRATPGAAPSIVWRGKTLAAARNAARADFGDRRDLTRQDVRIELAGGTFVEYAGPSR